MGIEGSASFHYVIAAALSLVGFFGFFFFDHLLKKVLAWNFFQLGILLLLVTLGFHPSGGAFSLNPLPHALAWGILAVTLAVTLVLFALSYTLYRLYGTFNVIEIAKRVKK